MSTACEGDRGPDGTADIFQRCLAAGWRRRGWFYHNCKGQAPPPRPSTDPIGEAWPRGSRLLSAQPVGT